jgi:hypothetical protein
VIVRTLCGLSEHGVVTMRGWLAVATAGWLLTGCVAAQMNANALDVASTIGDLQTRQVLQNLSRFIDDPDAIPAQAILLAGFVQARNSASASATFPLDMVNKFAREFTPSATIEWTDNWYLVPVTDGDDIRRLRALYRFAVYGNHAGDVPSPERPGPYDLDHSYVATDDAPPARVRAFTGEQAPDARGVLHTGWLFWTDDGPAAPSDAPPPGPGPYRPSAPTKKLYPLGHAGRHTLFTTDRAAWGDFVVAVLGATPAAHGGAARPALGGQ